MTFARKVWKLLVAVKDALVLILLLLFFSLLAAGLAGRKHGVVHDGALRVALNGAVVEEPADVDPTSLLLGGGGTPQWRARDVTRAIRGAAGDGRIKAVVVDLSHFGGAGLVHLEEIGAAMDAVRAAHKPVLLYGFALEDAGMVLAAHASEVWIDPLGGAFLPGPGGYNLYYGRLLDRLKITAHIFRVGTYKDFVEPYFRNDQSEPAREARKALIDAIWGEVKANIARARPRANIALVTGDPVGWIKAAGGDPARAALAAGLVDHIGNHEEFGARVAQIVGRDSGDSRPGAYAHSDLKPWLEANAENTGGRAIGVVTVAGDIVDGRAGPGTAGGDRIARAIDASAKANLAGLVVRVDSPGGSVTASEAIRTAILRVRARGIPVAVSMANVAASGGYWVSTPGSRIFAEPATITGSIGIFAVVPSFEKALASWGLNGDGVRATPLSGQPDVFSGLTPQVEAMLQADIENGYRRFVGLVAASRHQSPEAIDRIAQGRVWDGGTARQIGLVDQFGGLDDALAWTAGQAHLKAGDWHAAFLGGARTGWAETLDGLLHRQDDDGADGAATGGPRDWVGLVAARQRDGLIQALSSAERLVDAGGAQAYCLECGALAPASARAPVAASGLVALVARMVGWR